MANLNFLVTDFKKLQPQLRLMTRSSRTTGYFVVNGDLNAMKRTDPYEDSIYGITNLIAEKYFRSRYMHVITISMQDTTDTFLDIDITAIDNTMDILDQAFNEEVPVLCINLVARDIFKASTVAFKEAEDVCTIFRRYGYIDIGGEIHDFTIPKYVMLKANDTGVTAIIENEKTFW